MLASNRPRQIIRLIPLPRRPVKMRGDRTCRWICHWSVVSLLAVTLVLYSMAANVWILQQSCPPAAPAAPAPPPAPCDPCGPAGGDDPLGGLDVRLGRWDADRNYRLWDYAAVGAGYAAASAAGRVCLATQSSVDRLPELLKITAHWSGPLSVAVFVVGDELRLLRGFAAWLQRCHPAAFARLALHVATPRGRPAQRGAAPAWAADCAARPLQDGDFAAEVVKWRQWHPYPQNHLRNLARKNCHSPYVFLVDVDIVPSPRMAEALGEFLAADACERCAYVVPTYEVHRQVQQFPANKSELIKLSRRNLAIPFHKKVFIFNQHASNFSKWEASGGAERAAVHVSHNVTNFELLYEPFYVSRDRAPPHDERFVGYGYTRNSQLQEDADEDSLQSLAAAAGNATTGSAGAAAEPDGPEGLAACPELSGQIIGGRTSSILRYPYQVSMVLNGNSFCGGFIISPLYVLTAAHCVRNVAPSAIRLRVGSSRRDAGGRVVPVAQVAVHAAYDRPRYDNDIAALRLAAPLRLSRRVRAVRLPRAGQPVPLARLTVTGWGLTVVYEMFLQGYEFRVLSPIFTVHWGLQTRRSRPLWRERQNEGNRKQFQTFKRELFARYRKDPLHLMRMKKAPSPKDRRASS